MTKSSAPSDPLPSPERGSADLLPCPFCDDDQVVTHKLHGRHWAECMACEARGTVDYSQAKAIAAWNQRPSTSPQPAPSSLFQLGEFTLASGAPSAWKIECDALVADDWAALARMAVEILPPFGSVEGVPRGGIPFADALRPYATEGPLIIAEDVVTTGASMERHRAGRDAIGVAVFARGAPPAWVRPLFSMTPAPSSNLQKMQTDPSDGKEDGSSVAGVRCTVPLPVQTERPSPAGFEALAAELAKPQFMTTTSEGGRHSLEFTYHGEHARERRDALHKAIHIAGRAVNAQSSEAQPECSERSSDPTLSGTNNKTSDGLSRDDLLDLVSEALSDSIDMDWTCGTGARYVVDALIKEGIITCT